MLLETRNQEIMKPTLKPKQTQAHLLAVITALMPHDRHTPPERILAEKGEPELCRLTNDPHGELDRAADNLERVERLRAKLDAWWPGGAVFPRNHSDETQEPS